jgi:intergrase/recombinase
MTTLKSLMKKKVDLITKINSFSNLMKGTVYLSARKCSNPQCKCNHDGKKHTSFVLTYSKNGKTQTLSLKRDQKEKVKKLTENYKQIKKYILLLTDINAEIIKQEKKLKIGKQK